VQSFPITIAPGGVVKLTIKLDIPASKLTAVDLVQRPIDPLPDIQLDYSTPSEPGLWFPKNLGTGEFGLFIIFNPLADASKKMVPLVSGWAKSQKIKIYGIGIGDPKAAGDFWKKVTGMDATQGPFFSDPNSTIAAAFGVKPNDKGKYTSLPMVMMMSPDGKVIYLRDGYLLMTADYLSRAKELAGKAQ
jgi:hypothetical protein